MAKQPTVPQDIVIRDTDLIINDGKITVNKDAYLRNRPEGMTTAVEDQVDEYRSEYVAKVIEVVGRIAVDDTMAADPELDKVLITSNMHTSRLKLTVHRESVVSAGFGTSEKRTVYGRTSINVKTPYTNRKGVIKSTLDSLNEAARRNFAALKKEDK